MLAGLDHRFLQQTSDPELTDVAYDTRKLTPGCAFVCIRGAKLDSHALAAQAAEQGAAALIVEHAVDAPADIPVVQVADSRIALAEMLSPTELLNDPYYLYLKNYVERIDEMIERKRIGMEKYLPK